MYRMRLPLAVMTFVILLLLGFVVYYLAIMPPAYRDTIRHVASTQPESSALHATRHATTELARAPDLSQRPGLDWPVFLGPSGDGKSQETPIRPWPAEGPRLVWSTEAGEGYCQPVTCRGRLLLFERVKTEVRCRCLHAETGAELWRFGYTSEYVDRQGYDGGPRASPATDGRRVFLHGPEGMLHCLRLHDGELLWRIDTAATFGIVQNLFGAASSPIPFQDKVLLQIGGSPAGSTDARFLELESNGTCIVAFDKQSGQVRYKCGQDLASYSSPQVVNLAGQATGLVFARGGLVLFDPEHGVERLRFPFRSKSYNAVNASNAVIQESQVFLTESYELGSTLLNVTGDKAEPAWTVHPRDRERGLACHWNTPILVDGFLYGCASRHRGDAELRCIEFATGKVRWIARPSIADEPAGRSSLLHADGCFYYLTEDGDLFMLRASPERYEELASWRGRSAALRFPCWAAPVLSRGLLYVRGKDRLTCVEVQSE